MSAGLAELSTMLLIEVCHAFAEIALPSSFPRNLPTTDYWHVICYFVEFVELSHLTN